MRKLEFEDNSFDGIWSCASLIHIPKQEVESVLLNFKRVLKPESILFIGVKEGSGESVNEGMYDAPRLFVYYEKGEIDRMLEKNGFEIVKSVVERDRMTNTGNWIEIFARVKK